jgi:hypothetical protein
VSCNTYRLGVINSGALATACPTIRYMWEGLIDSEG